MRKPPVVSAFSVDSKDETIHEMIGKLTQQMRQIMESNNELVEKITQQEKVIKQQGLLMKKQEKTIFDQGIVINKLCTKINSLDKRVKQIQIITIEDKLAQQQLETIQMKKMIKNKKKKQKDFQSSLNNQQRKTTKVKKLSNQICKKEEQELANKGIIIIHEEEEEEQIKLQIKQQFQQRRCFESDLKKNKGDIALLKKKEETSELIKFEIIKGEDHQQNFQVKINNKKKSHKE